MRATIFGKLLKPLARGTFSLKWSDTEISAAETSKMTARLGRASYVGGESLPPDPGAVGIAALVEGIANAFQK
jgi:hypothetical protein